MKKQADGKKKPNFFITLLRDIFFGGKGYKTVTGEKTPFPLAIILTSVIATGLTLAMVFSFIKISEVSASIASMKKELVTLSLTTDILLKKLKTPQGSSDSRMTRDKPSFWKKRLRNHKKAIKRVNSRAGYA